MKSLHGQPSNSLCTVNISMAPISLLKEPKDLSMPQSYRTSYLQGVCFIPLAELSQHRCVCASNQSCSGCIDIPDTWSNGILTFAPELFLPLFLACPTFRGTWLRHSDGPGRASPAGAEGSSGVRPGLCNNLKLEERMCVLVWLLFQTARASDAAW